MQTTIIYAETLETLSERIQGFLKVPENIQSTGGKHGFYSVLKWRDAEEIVITKCNHGDPSKLSFKACVHYNLVRAY